MTHNKGPSRPDGPDFRAPVTRRQVLTGMIAAAAIPAVIGRVLASPAPSAPAPIRMDPGPGDLARPIDREFHTTTETIFGTMIVGGFRYAALQSVQVFDGRVWREAPPLLMPRFKHAAVFTSAGLLVVGGISTAGQTLTSAELFDGNQWRKVASMKFPRSLLAAVGYNGGVLAIGGMDRQPLAVVEMFDGGGWQRMPSLTMPRFGHSAGLDSGNPTVTGGSYLAPLHTTESFDGVSWTAGPVISSVVSQAAR